MSAEFNWWLLIVGVVAGAALTWLVVADSSAARAGGRRARAARRGGVDRAVARPRRPSTRTRPRHVLRAHRRYLGFPPPDVLVAPEELAALEEQGLATEPPSRRVAAEPEAVADGRAAAMTAADAPARDDARVDAAAPDDPTG